MDMPTNITILHPQPPVRILSKPMTYALQVVTAEAPNNKGVFGDFSAMVLVRAKLFMEVEDQATALGYGPVAECIRLMRCECEKVARMIGDIGNRQPDGTVA